jgi:hypothetical protein
MLQRRSKLASTVCSNCIATKKNDYGLSVIRIDGPCKVRKSPQTSSVYSLSQHVWS